MKKRFQNKEIKYLFNYYSSIQLFKLTGKHTNSRFGIFRWTDVIAVFPGVCSCRRLRSRRQMQEVWLSLFSMQIVCRLCNSHSTQCAPFQAKTLTESWNLKKTNLKKWHEYKSENWNSKTREKEENTKMK